MNVQRSRITAQGQISVPSSVRGKLGVGPGSVLEWTEDDGRIIVQRVGQYSSEDIHRAVFGPEAPARKTLAQLKEGIGAHIRKRCARG